MRILVIAACLSCLLIAACAMESDDMPVGTTFPDDDWMTSPIPEGDSWSDRENERILREMDVLRD